MDQLVELTSKGICLGSYQDRGKKLGLWPRVITEAKRYTFWPRPNMPRFQTRGKMSKITGAESPFCTGVGLNIFMGISQKVCLNDELIMFLVLER